MRKICLVKVVIPEVVAYCSSQKHGFTTDYKEFKEFLKRL